MIDENVFDESSSMDKTNSIQVQLKMLYNIMFEPGQDHSKLADSMLFEIKRMCFAYLENPRLIDEISTEQIANMYEFILLKLAELENLKTTLNIKNIHSVNFSELEMQMQKYKKHSLNFVSEEILYNEIDHNITGLFDILSFSYAVFRHIVRDRNLFNG